jgi:hypothetical protein
MFIAAIIVVLFAGCSRQQPKESTASNPNAPATIPQPVSPPGQPPSAMPAQASTGQPPEPAVMTIPAGTRIHVRLAQALDTRHVRAGESFTAHLDQPVYDAGQIVIPKGVAFHGHIVEAKGSGRFKGRAHLEITLDSFTLHGESYRIATSISDRSSGGHKKRNAILIGGGTGAGAAIGALAGGGMGAGIGAASGAAAGVTTAFFTGKKNVRLPAETPIVFSLRSPIDVRG